MGSVRDKIIETLNVMRGIVFKSSKSVEVLEELCPEESFQRAALDAIRTSEFQKDKIHYILVLIKRDIWRHRHAIEGYTLNVKKIPADMQVFWTKALDVTQRSALIKTALCLIDLVTPIADHERWDDAVDQEWAIQK